MAFSRYENVGSFKNDRKLYRKLLDCRDVDFIKQFRSSKLKYPSDEQIATLNIVSHLWVRGDRLYKLANKFYGDSELWWVIAWFNKKPAETLISLGDTVLVPFPLERAIEFMGV